ncbi:unnamed protein product [Arctia plantaginis]|uniref:Uncharacterized protein n=1 Tax=Arctia plantaginis TaxID=874455 RepID=A0A8S1A3R8_ARCPL|nr:unnamed protein product [Arctia plantaginis]
MATHFPAVIEAIDYGCGCQRPVCSDQLILPPLAVELPPGLGYFESALPLVADYFEPAIEYMTTGAYLPITSKCDCLTLAAPVSPEIAPLVKPIIL